MLFSKSALAIALATTAATVTADSLRGPVVQSTIDKLSSPDIHCNQKSHDSSNCSSVKSATGDNCVWCQVKENEGACLSRDDAGYVMDLFNLPCPDYASLLEEQKDQKSVDTPDVMCMLATIGGEQSCEQMPASDGSNCVWCAGTHAPGACLSAKDAVFADDKFGLSCPSVYEDIETDEEDEVSVSADTPDVMCMVATIFGEQSCEQSQASDGSGCVWCTGTHAPGACLSAKDAVFADNKFGLSCKDVKTEEEVEVSDQPNIDPGMIDTTCFMAAWNADNAEEACGETKADDGSQCVWCETQGDTMGACLHSEQAEIFDGKFNLSCPTEKTTTYVETDRD